MRPKLNKVTWNVVHIDIAIDIHATVVNSSYNNDITKEEFFDSVVDAIVSNGFIPLDTIENMKKNFRSPYSESEYYTFLKVEDAKKLKLVLDARVAGHPLKEWGNHSAHDRHKHYMETEMIPELAKNKKLDTSDTQSEFIDVIEQPFESSCIVTVNGTMCSGYRDALQQVKEIVESIK